MLAFISSHVTRRGKCNMPLSYRRIYRLTPTKFSIVAGNNRSDLKVEGFLIKKKTPQCILWVGGVILWPSACLAYTRPRVPFQLGQTQTYILVI